MTHFGTRRKNYHFFQIGICWNGLDIIGKADLHGFFIQNLVGYILMDTDPTITGSFFQNMVGCGPIDMFIQVSIQIKSHHGTVMI